MTKAKITPMSLHMAKLDSKTCKTWTLILQRPALGLYPRPPFPQKSMLVRLVGINHGRPSTLTFGVEGVSFTVKKCSFLAPKWPFSKAKTSFLKHFGMAELCTVAFQFLHCVQQNGCHIPSFLWPQQDYVTHAYTRCIINVQFFLWGCMFSFRAFSYKMTWGEPNLWHWSAFAYPVSLWAKPGKDEGRHKKALFISAILSLQREICAFCKAKQPRKASKRTQNHAKKTIKDK